MASTPGKQARAQAHYGQWLWRQGIPDPQKENPYADASPEIIGGAKTGTRGEVEEGTTSEIA